MLRRLLRAVFGRSLSRARGRVPGKDGDVATRVVAAPRRGLAVVYAPSRNGAPDPGEIVWSWVPYAEGDGQGKDRPLLIVARQDPQRVYALRLTSKPQDGDARFVSIGSGGWDARGRPSWVDVSRLYSVHVDGMRREAAAVSRPVFDRVAASLRRRSGLR